MLGSHLAQAKEMTPLMMAMHLNDELASACVTALCAHRPAAYAAAATQRII